MEVNTVNAFLSLAGSFGEGPIDEGEIQTIHAELQGSPPSDDNWPSGPTGVRAIRRIILELRDTRREVRAPWRLLRDSLPDAPKSKRRRPQSKRRPHSMRRARPPHMAHTADTMLSQ